MPSAPTIAPKLFLLSKDFTRPEILIPTAPRSPTGGSGGPGSARRVDHGLPRRWSTSTTLISARRWSACCAHRRQDQPARAAEAAALRQGAEARRRTRSRSFCWAGRRRPPTSTTCSTTSWVAATIRRITTRRGESRRYCSKYLDALADKVCSRSIRQARSADQAGVRNLLEGLWAISRCISRRWHGAYRKR